jgi:cysteine desulfurase/selenocysteine lyase
MNSVLDIKKIRADFPILESRIYGKPLVYLDNAATTQKPNQVMDRILAFYLHSNSNIHRGVHYLSEQASDAYEASRESVRKFINANNAREIIFTHGTTESINLLAHCFGHQWIKKDDEIIITELEHHSNILPWQALCKRNGAVLKVIPFHDDGFLDTKVLDSLITSKTKLIAITYISNVLGIVNPVKDIIEQAHSFDIPVLIDGAQAVQHTSIDVRTLDCDFFVFSGHKMYAETGIGVLYGKEKWLEKMQPYQYGGGMVTAVDLNKTTYADLPFKFEAGTPNIAGAVSMQAAIEYMDSIGLEAIHAHEKELLEHALKGLTSINGVSVYNGTAPKCGVISFNINKISSYDASLILDKLGIAVRSGTHCAELIMKHFQISGTIRASFALYNTKEEIDSLINGVDKAQALLH